MPQPPQPEEGFSDEDLARPDRLWLKRAASQIRWRQRRKTSDYIAIGKVLLEAKKRLGYGAFGKWVHFKVQISPRTSSRFQLVASAFGHLPKEVVNRIDFSALALMTESGKVPEDKVEYAAEKATEGERVTYEEILEYCRNDPTLAPKKLAQSKDPVRVVDADDVHAAENWSILCSELRLGSTLHLTGHVDEGAYHVTGFRIAADGTMARSAGRSEEVCVLELTGRNRRKICDTCGVLKKLDDFYKDKESRDGRGKRCQECERKRVKSYEERKKVAVIGGEL